MALNDVPQPAQTLGATQNDIRVNFTTINRGFSVDHVTFNAPEEGFHNKVTFVDQTGGQLPVTVNNPNIALYASDDATTGQPELYLKRQSDGVNLGLPITEKVVSLGGQVGHTYLPSGVLLQWGNGASIAPNTSVTVIFSKAFSGNNTYSITWSAQINGSNAVSLLYLSGQTATTATFTLAGNIPTTTNQIVLRYFVIGI